MIEAGHQRRRRLVTYAISMALTIGLAIIYISYRLLPVNVEPRNMAALISGGLLIVGILATAGFGYRAATGHIREFILIHVTILIALTISFGLAELAARLYLPPWPASHLHGVSPEIGPQAWGQVQSLHPNATRNNSWGQRDAERSLSKRPGSTRIAFVGDSVLEESSIVPVSLLVDRQLGDDFEVLNLGISASFPTDYYNVVRNVALRLDVDAIYTFVYIGNDFLPYPDKRHPLRRAFYSPPPQSSLLGMIAPGINYLITQKHKFTTNTWLGTDRHTTDQNELKYWQTVSLDDLPASLAARYSPPGEISECLETLRKRDFSTFHKALVAPDMGLFNSYALSVSVCKHEQLATKEFDPANITAKTEILAKIQHLCDEAGVIHRVVIVPSGLEVDTRLQQQWSSLPELQRRYGNYSAVTEKLSSLLEERSIVFVDLHEILKGEPGNYLNFDFHWSTRGNERVAAHLTQWIQMHDEKDLRKLAPVTR